MLGAGFMEAFAGEMFYDQKVDAQSLSLVVLSIIRDLLGE